MAFHKELDFIFDELEPFKLKYEKSESSYYLSFRQPTEVQPVTEADQQQLKNNSPIYVALLKAIYPRLLDFVFYADEQTAETVLEESDASRLYRVDKKSHFFVVTAWPNMSPRAGKYSHDVINCDYLLKRLRHDPSQNLKDFKTHLSRIDLSAEDLKKTLPRLIQLFQEKLIDSESQKLFTNDNIKDLHNKIPKRIYALFDKLPTGRTALFTLGIHILQQLMNQHGDYQRKTRLLLSTWIKACVKFTGHIKNIKSLLFLLENSLVPSIDNVIAKTQRTVEQDFTKDEGALIAYFYRRCFSNEERDELIKGLKETKVSLLKIFEILTENSLSSNFIKISKILLKLEKQDPSLYLYSIEYLERYVKEGCSSDRTTTDLVCSTLIEKKRLWEEIKKKMFMTLPLPSLHDFSLFIFQESVRMLRTFPRER